MRQDKNSNFSKKKNRLIIKVWAFFFTVQKQSKMSKSCLILPRYKRFSIQYRNQLDRSMNMQRTKTQ